MSALPEHQPPIPQQRVESGKNFERLAREVMERCDLLAECSDESGCLTRPCYSPAMHRAHLTLTNWMQEVGLEVKLDAVGNLCGVRSAAGGDPGAQTILIGSHLDTVPNAGKYDGQLGIICGLGIAEALRDTPLPFNLEVIAFTDEEGVRFAQPYLGSLALSGHFPDHCLERCDSNGTSLADALSDFLTEPLHVKDACRRREDILGYLEIHIEQGPVLERMHVPLSAVEGIAGQSRLLLQFKGEAGHAGTVPMTWRRDAAIAAARIIASVREEALKIEGLRATVGQLKVKPNVRNVIPAEATISIDIRHMEDGSRELGVNRILDMAKQIAEEETTPLTVLQNSSEATVKTDPYLTRRLQLSMSESGYTPHLMPSGAGHDTVAIAPHFPATMLFVRHPGGISHHPAEQVHEADVASALQVASHFIKSLAVSKNEEFLTDAF